MAAASVLVFLVGAVLLFLPRASARAVSVQSLPRQSRAAQSLVGESLSATSLSEQGLSAPSLTGRPITGQAAPASVDRRYQLPVALNSSAVETSTEAAGSVDDPGAASRAMRRVGLVAACLVAIIIHPALLGPLGLILWIFPWWRKRVIAARDAALLVAALPATLDLFAVVLGSGGTISQSMDVVRDRGAEAVRPAFVLVGRRRAAGQGFVSVLADLPDYLGEAYRPLVRALVATERDGAPIASLLLRLGEEASTSRRRAAEARAKALSVQLLLPLVVCFLPAVIVGAIAPLVIVAASQFVP